MTSPLLSAHKTHFTNYARSFLSGRDADDYNLQLKIDHTFRVLENAETICQGESLNSTVADMSLLAAFYHDIGRFIQYRDHKTFNDRESINHGLTGVSVLHREQFLKNLPTAFQRTVIPAVGMHNRKKIPLNTPEPLRTVCGVVRDSDKLDIIPVMLEHLDSEEPNHVVVMNAHPDVDRYTPELVEEILAGRIGNYNLLKWTNDFKLLIASWVFDLNFKTSYWIFEKNKYIDRIFSVLPETEIMTTVKQYLQQHLANRIK